jgi:Tfp pilus assembly protein PilO
MTEAQQTEHSEDIEDLTAEIARVRKSFQIACINVVALTDQRTALTAALDRATLLLDQLLTEMRLANVTPSSGVIFHKAGLDQAMHKLLALKPPPKPEPDNGDFSPR